MIRQIHESNAIADGTFPSGVIHHMAIRLAFDSDQKHL